jgi:hypothetical protein
LRDRARYDARRQHTSRQQAPRPRAAPPIPSGHSHKTHRQRNERYAHGRNPRRGMAAIARPCQLGTRMRPIDWLGRRGQDAWVRRSQADRKRALRPARFIQKPGNSPTTAPNAARERLKPGDSRRDFAARFGQVGPASPGRNGTAERPEQPARRGPGPDMFTGDQP